MSRTRIAVASYTDLDAVSAVLDALLDAGISGADLALLTGPDCNWPTRRAARLNTIPAIMVQRAADLDDSGLPSAIRALVGSLSGGNHGATILRVLDQLHAGHCVLLVHDVDPHDGAVARLLLESRCRLIEFHDTPPQRS